MNERRVRVRFAPSPTGPLHIGGLRTALFNYLFAKKYNGDFILRIEDTDQNRYVKGAEDYIIESLNWCNIPFDEGVGKGGDFAPYRQSERKEIYAKYSQELIDKGLAYYAFDTPEELEAMRERLKAEKSANQQYNALTRGSMTNSFTLSEEETQKRIAEGKPYVVRFKMPEDEELKVYDIIRGEVVFNTSRLDDKVLFKSDGMPTYHLANIVDDHLMEISHVIRGEEWLPSLPLHVLLYRSFGWEDTMPQFAHLPLLLKPNGKGKLSKRDGDQMGFPVFPLEWTDPKTGDVASGYRESGYFADSFINLLALLGWNSGTEQEIFTLEELTQIFSLEKVSKSGAKFDPAKAHWFNHQYITKKSNEELAKLYLPILEEKGIKVDENLVVTICGEIKERANFVSDFWEQSNFFFQAPTEYDKKTVKKQWKEATPEIITELANVFEGVENFDAVNAKQTAVDFLTAKELGMGKVMNPLRLALVGAGKGPDLFLIVELLGKEECIKRMKAAVENIKK